jgi:hypothetical protein
LVLWPCEQGLDTLDEHHHHEMFNMIAFKMFDRTLSAGMRRHAWRAGLAFTAAALLAACGGDSETPEPTPQYTLSVSANGSGSVSSQPLGVQCGSTCSADFDAGTTVTLTASAAPGQVFSAWGGDCIGTAATCTVTMDAAHTVTAGFAPPPATSAALTVSVVGGGTVRSQPAGIDCGTACSATYAIDTRVALSATPDTGQVFSGWGGACTGAGAICTVTMNQARSVGATFATAPAVQRTLSVTPTGNGTVRSLPVGIDCGSSCSAGFGEGASVVLSATPAAGQRFAGWSGACTGADAICALTLSQDLSVGAAFTVAPAAPIWQTPLLLENSNDFNVSNRLLAASSPNGDAIVMWEQSDGTPDGNTRKLFARRYVSGQGWGAAAAVPGLSASSDSQVLIEGKLLMDAAGTATWLRPNLETRRFSAAGWSPPFLPPPRTGGLLSAAAIDASGAITALISGSDVYVNKLPANANSWLDWVGIDASGTLPAQAADLAIGVDGTAIAIWRERNPGDANYSIKAARYVPQAGGWQTPVSIDASFDNVSPETPPRVAADAAGNAIAVWHQGNSLYYNVFSVTGGWGTAVQVDANAVDSIFTAEVRIVMTPAGRAVVTWRSGLFGLKSMQYAPGAGFSAPVLVNGYTSYTQLGQDAEGNAVVVYVSPDRWPNPTTGSDVYSRRLTWGGAWSDAVAIEPLDGLGASAVAAFNSEGAGAAAWVRGDVAGTSARRSLWVNLLR